MLLIPNQMAAARFMADYTKYWAVSVDRDRRHYLDITETLCKERVRSERELANINGYDYDPDSG